MANIKSAKKRILVNETKAARNKAIKSKVKTAVKKVEAAVAAKDAETAKTALRAAIVEISKAGTKGVYHKKTVSRKISRLSKAVKTAVKKVEAAVAAKDAETAKTALRAAIVEISKAGTKGVYHKKTVSRKISRLSKAVSSIA